MDNTVRNYKYSFIILQNFFKLIPDIKVFIQFNLVHDQSTRILFQCSSKRSYHEISKEDKFRWKHPTGDYLLRYLNLLHQLD